jgi:chromosomal replication initiator protein
MSKRRVHQVQVLPKYTLDDFVVGPANRLAHESAVGAAGGGGPRHSPLFWYGGTGLGKTHLVHALAHHFHVERPRSRILHVAAEQFVNELVQSRQQNRMSEFRSRYRDRCDLLLVEDVQFLIGRPQTQEELFQTLGALHQADKQVVITSDRPPRQLVPMDERLVACFSWGLIAEIKGPELETRVAILRKKAQLEQIGLSDEVVLTLAQTIRSNVRELEGMLNRLVAKSSLRQRSLDLDFARQELAVARHA